ncbi:sulfatase [Carboxylicivirga mesophila]|uniref:Sulfatase n=1 Tax=Carboxylicivirga mesophila TaxID=1166478 RepID=A0ABS5KBJ4_9BACT|nr:sulfatase [Carboxylicivirga mesophila]MBS2212399.1 sulfatase [Carboxylicivirga mesophila]
MKNTINQLLAAVVILLAFACSPVKTERPNIVFIISDDHAEQAISAYGHGLNQTPNIDRLAKEGVLFTNATVTNSICAPSRAVILTGKHSHKNGLINNEVTFDGGQATFPKLLKEAGYYTAIVGKWHLKSEPTGFDQWMVLPGQGEYYNPDFRTPQGLVCIPGYVTNIITDKAIEWLEGIKQEDKPFCLMVQHKAPHRNWMPAPQYLNQFDQAEIPVPDNFFDDYSTRGRAAREQEMEIDKIMFEGYDLKLTKPGTDDIIRDGWGDWYERMSDEQKVDWHNDYRAKNQAYYDAELSGKEKAIWKYQRYMQDYLSTIASVDDGVGEILDYLDANGLADNTIVVYTSDQGFYLGEHGWFDKRFMYEESLSTPLLLRYPEGVKKGWVCDKLVQNLDFAQTFLDYAGVEVPEEMQGLSMRPVLEQNSDAWRDAVYYHYYEYPGIHAVKRHYGISTGRYKLIHFYFDTDEWEFYDLETDPQEMNNQYGNAEYATLIEELKAQLVKLKQQYEVPSIEQEMGERFVTLTNKAKGAKVTMKQMPDKPYDAPISFLCDGKGKNFTPLWASDYDTFLGFNGNDMQGVIELNELTAINEIKMRFLDKRGSWVYAPQQVEIFISKDGRSYEQVQLNESQQNEVLNNVYLVAKGATGMSVEARYIRVKVSNFGLIPEGKPGAGQPSWLFCDEFIVK